MRHPPVAEFSTTHVTHTARGFTSDSCSGSGGNSVRSGGGRSGVDYERLSSS